MTKAELVEKIYTNAGLRSKAEAERALDAVIVLVGEELSKGDKISFHNLGSFQVVERPERKGRNPQTGEEIILPARKVVKFIPAKALRESVNA